MSILQLLGSTLGLGLVSGLNLYATVLTVGIGIRFGFIQLHPELQTLEVLANPFVLLVAALVFVVQFLADKIKWVDSLWDAIHSFIRPLGASLIGATSVGEVGPEMLIVGALCGGVAISGHSTKAGVRLVANHSPEPFSNIALSLTEDVLVVLGSWVSLQYPTVMLGIVVIFMILFLWFAPKAFRLIRLETIAVFAIFKKLFSNLQRYLSLIRRRLMRIPGPLEPKTSPETFDGRRLSEVLNAKMPLNYIYYVNDKLRLGNDPARIRCAAGKGLRGLRYSVGYLNITSDQIVFVTRRLFRFRSTSIPKRSIDHVHFGKHLMLDRLSLRVRAKKPHVFYLFKDALHTGEILYAALDQSTKQNTPDRHRS